MMPAKRKVVVEIWDEDDLENFVWKIKDKVRELWELEGENSYVDASAVLEAFEVRE